MGEKPNRNSNGDISRIRTGVTRNVRALGLSRRCAGGIRPRSSSGFYMSEFAGGYFIYPGT